MRQPHDKNKKLCILIMQLHSLVLNPRTLFMLTVKVLPPASTVSLFMKRRPALAFCKTFDSRNRDRAKQVFSQRQRGRNFRH
jgi:hypothetical protein